MRLAAFALSVTGSLLALAAGSQAAVIQLASPASLSPGDATLIYPGTVGSAVASPASFSAGGNTLTFSAAGGGFELDQAGLNYGGTAFPNGTRILYAGGFQGATAPITLSFANPVSEFGVNAEDFNAANYTISFTAFDGAMALGTFTASGNDPNTLSFEGLRATGGDVITSVRISDNAGNNIGLGPVSFPGATVKIPEPGSIALLGTGLLILGVIRRRR